MNSSLPEIPSGKLSSLDEAPPGFQECGRHCGGADGWTYPEAMSARRVQFSSTKCPGEWKPNAVITVKVIECARQRVGRCCRGNSFRFETCPGCAGYNCRGCDGTRPGVRPSPARDAGRLPNGGSRVILIADPARDLVRRESRPGLNSEARSEIACKPPLSQTGDRDSGRDCPVGPPERRPPERRLWDSTTRKIANGKRMDSQPARKRAFRHAGRCRHAGPRRCAVHRHHRAVLRHAPDRRRGRRDPCARAVR